MKKTKMLLIGLSLAAGYNFAFATKLDSHSFNKDNGKYANIDKENLNASKFLEKENQEIKPSENMDFPNYCKKMMLDFFEKNQEIKTSFDKIKILNKKGEIEEYAIENLISDIITKIYERNATEYMLGNPRAGTVNFENVIVNEEDGNNKKAILKTIAVTFSENENKETKINSITLQTQFRQFEDLTKIKEKKEKKQKTFDQNINNFIEENKEKLFDSNSKIIVIDYETNLNICQIKEYNEEEFKNLIKENIDYGYINNVLTYIDYENEDGIKIKKPFLQNIRIAVVKRFEDTENLNIKLENNNIEIAPKISNKNENQEQEQQNYEDFQSTPILDGKTTIKRYENKNQTKLQKVEKSQFEDPQLKDLGKIKISELQNEDLTLLVKKYNNFMEGYLKTIQDFQTDLKSLNNPTYFNYIIGYANYLKKYTNNLIDYIQKYQNKNYINKSVPLDNNNDENNKKSKINNNNLPIISINNNNYIINDKENDENSIDNENNIDYENNFQKDMEYFYKKRNKYCTLKNKLNKALDKFSNSLNKYQENPENYDSEKYFNKMQTDFNLLDELYNNLQETYNELVEDYKNKQEEYQNNQQAYANTNYYEFLQNCAESIDIYFAELDEYNDELQNYDEYLDYYYNELQKSEEEGNYEEGSYEEEGNYEEGAYEEEDNEEINDEEGVYEEEDNEEDNDEEGVYEEEDNYEDGNYEEEGNEEVNYEEDNKNYRNYSMD